MLELKISNENLLEWFQKYENNDYFENTDDFWASFFISMKLEFSYNENSLLKDALIKIFESKYNLYLKHGSVYFMSKSKPKGRRSFSKTPEEKRKIRIRLARNYFS